MFNALKNKFNHTVGKITEKISKEAKDEGLIDEKPPKTSKSPDKEYLKHGDLKTDEDVEKIDSESFFSRLRRKSSTESYQDKNESNKIYKDSEEEVEVEPDEKKVEKSKSGVFSFIRERTISEADIEDILWELEISLLESDVALEVAEKIISSVKDELVDKKIKRSTDVANYTKEALKNAISTILDVETKNIEDLIKEKKSKGEPLIIMFVGINGTGKTTTIAKFSTFFKNKGYTPVIAASDTFRAGAIEQLSHHAQKIGVKIIKHQKGADPAAVAFDAVSHAKAQGKELVLVDTAGRMQTNINLMDEMVKIKRVANPDLIIFVGDSLTGNDAVEQARKFNEAVGLDGIILTKADADAKGGAALSIGYVISKPILFLGTGQSYEDLLEFHPQWMVEQLI